MMKPSLFLQEPRGQTQGPKAAVQVTGVPAHLIAPDQSLFTVDDLINVLRWMRFEDHLLPEESSVTLPGRSDAGAVA